VVICLERSADLHIAQRMPLPLTVSCSSKIQIGFAFLVPADLGSPGQRAIKQVCVCVCVCVRACVCFVIWIKRSALTHTHTQFTHAASKVTLCHCVLYDLPCHSITTMGVVSYMQACSQNCSSLQWPLWN